MLINKQHLLLISEQSQMEGEGSLVAIYNDIEQKWYYYVGEFKAKNPSNHIHQNSIRGKCVNKILENSHTYFSGDLAKKELIVSEIRNIQTEQIDFDFKFIWFR